MDYLVDTKICIHFFRGKYGVTDRFEAVKAENCAISGITLAELFFSAENSENPEKNHSLIEQLLKIVTIIPIYDSAMYLFTLPTPQKSSQLIMPGGFHDSENVEHVRENGIHTLFGAVG